MGRIVVDATLREKLGDLKQPLEFCDESGKVVARLTPAYDPAEYEPLEPQISEEELQRRAQSTKWYSTPEVLAHLRSLEQQ